MDREGFQLQDVMGILEGLSALLTGQNSSAQWELH